MISTLIKQIFSIGLSSLLVITSSPLGAGAQQPAPAESGAGAAPFTANDLQQLVAPIALYPDAR